MTPQQASVLLRFTTAAEGGNPLLDTARGLVSCPRCGLTARKENFKILALEEQFRVYLVEIYKCAACLHLFAPLPQGEKHAS